MSKLKVLEGGHYSFTCPGCQRRHSIGPNWEFNGDLNSPTFTPSLLVRSGCHAPGHKPGDNCWCTYNRKRLESERSSFTCGTCHSFITDGKIQFLNDCTHNLAGQTAELPEI